MSARNIGTLLATLRNIGGNIGWNNGFGPPGAVDSAKEDHDWLGKPENRVLFEVAEGPRGTGEETVAPTLPLAPQ